MILEAIWCSVGIIIAVLALIFSGLLRSVIRASFKHPLSPTDIIYRPGAVAERDRV